MNGSMLSQPPRFIPRITRIPYSHLSFSAGTLLFACLLSSQVEFRPMVDSPPTVALVNVRLKSVVSYQVEKSRMVPCASGGIEPGEAM